MFLSIINEETSINIRSRISRESVMCVKSLIVLDDAAVFHNIEIFSPDLGCKILMWRRYCFYSVIKKVLQDRPSGQSMISEKLN